MLQICTFLYISTSLSLWNGLKTASQSLASVSVYRYNKIKQYEGCSLSKRIYVTLWHNAQ